MQRSRRGTTQNQQVLSKAVFSPGAIWDDRRRGATQNQQVLSKAVFSPGAIWDDRRTDRLFHILRASAVRRGMLKPRTEVLGTWVGRKKIPSPVGAALARYS